MKAALNHLNIKSVDELMAYGYLYTNNNNNNNTTYPSISIICFLFANYSASVGNIVKTFKESLELNDLQVNQLCMLMRDIYDAYGKNK